MPLNWSGRFSLVCEFAPPTEARFIPAQMSEKVKVEKTWDLNAIRGGKFGIGWTMNQKLWPDADKVY